MDKYKYVLIFLKYNDKILLLNRKKAPWMGCWNGIGGKIEEGETPHQAALRETFEETGIKLDSLEMLSTVSWIIDDDESTIGGMYCFLKEINNPISTPQISEEGILDWKEIEWILNDQNSGIARNLKAIIPKMLTKKKSKFRCYYHLQFDSFIKIEEMD